MSSGAPHHGPIDADRERELRQLLDNPDFAKAVAAYRNEDDTHDIPYLGGSDTGGTTVFYDRAFVAAIKAGKVKIDGKPIDPRPALKVHETIEGAEIRLLHYDYTRAHDIATVAEQHTVAHLGWDWAKYEAALAPFIHSDEIEKITNPPPNLLLVAYEGKGGSTDSPLYRKLAAFQRGDGNATPPSTPGSPLDGGKPPNSEPDMAMTPRQQFDAKVAAGRSMAAPPMAPMAAMPAPDAAPPMAPPPMPGPALPVAHTLAHGRAIAGAKALHAVGHISEAARDKHVNASMKAIGKPSKVEAPRKPFGSFAPMGR